MELLDELGVAMHGSRKHSDSHQLGGIGLGSSDRFFITSAYIDDKIGSLGQGGIGGVGDRQCRPALTAAFFQDAHDIRRLSGLRYAKHQGTVQPGRLFVKRKQRWGRQGKGQVVKGAPQIIGVTPGVIGGATRRQESILDVMRAQG